MPELKPSPAIRLRGVRHNNLKNFDLDLPLNRLIVITGLSGSGKSSLAFDTLYAEGQRRYIETFSPYARQFFDRMDKPQVDSIEGIPPAIAVEQRNAVRTTRSTVGTMTEICDHMKILWPHLAQLHCRGCGQPVRKDSPHSVWQRMNDECQMANDEIIITFDLPRSEKLSLDESLALISKQGYQRLLVDGKLVRLDETAVHLRHSSSELRHFTVIQDRLTFTSAHRARFVEACEQAYHFGKGKLAIHELDAGVSPFAIRHSSFFSNRLHCAKCDLEYREPAPALFSFNHPLGACPACKGFGRIITIDYELAIPDRALTLAGGAVKPWRGGFSAECQRDLKKFCRIRRVPMDVPFDELSAEHQQWIIEGDKDYGIDEEHQWPRAWYGVKGYFKWLETKSYKMHVRVLLSRYRAYTKCPECEGARLKPEALLYRCALPGSPVFSNQYSVFSNQYSVVSSGTPLITDALKTEHSSLSLADFYTLPVQDALALVDRLARPHSLKPNDPLSIVLQEVRARLGYLNEVGLGYLTLDRPTRTLSGGETERVNLTTCLGTRLVNTIFVLDEPSVGLHPRDTDRLVRILEKLRDTGNTVVVVEHEASVMRAADQIVDLGPGHGATGGQVVFQGPLRDLLKSKVSLTGAYLSGRRQIEMPQRRPVGNTKSKARNSKEIRSTKSESELWATNRRDSESGLLSDFGVRISGLKWLTILNATHHNLKSLSVAIPLGRLVCITGVSGSGKSTLVREVLYPALTERLKFEVRNPKSEISKASDHLDDEDKGGDHAGSSAPPRHSSSMTGHEHLDRAVFVDQSILGKTPRSNPAVYIGAFDDIREFFAQSEPAKRRGFNASAFSFNSGQGQCERCRGAGFEKIEMQFLSDVFIRCPECNGRRYRPHILEVKVSSQSSAVSREAAKRNKAADHGLRTTDHSWSIADLLEATVDEAIAFLNACFESKPALRAASSLKLLQEVGLGYLRLGQPINTLSGGESQRLKLVRHLAEATQANDRADEKVRKWERENAESHLPTFSPAHFPTVSSENSGVSSGRTLFLFDEPTTGLHFDDVRVLLRVFQRLVEAGHSVVVIEHNLDVIKCADWVIDLGPEAGEGGGHIVAQGTPEQVAACDQSHTGKALKRAGLLDVLPAPSKSAQRSTAAHGPVNGL